MGPLHEQYGTGAVFGICVCWGGGGGVLEDGNVLITASDGAVSTGRGGGGGRGARGNRCPQQGSKVGESAERG